MVAHVPEYPWSEEDGVLIKIDMEIGGCPVVAVIDTGSQLDVIREKVAEKILHQPIDLTKAIQMNDANGGESTLKGRIDGVHLMCGGVSTVANLYVSNDRVPFDLLLGRRWQRRNLVGIDERKNGTYLIFKDPRNHKPRHKLKVRTEIITESEARSFRTFMCLGSELEQAVQGKERGMGNEDQLKAASAGSNVHEGESQEKQRKHYDIGTEGLAGSAEVSRVQIKLNSDFSISLQTFLVQDSETDASHHQEYLNQQSGTSTEGMRYKRPLKTLFLSPLPHYPFTPKTIPDSWKFAISFYDLTCT
jgi:predicted aspartyl protease